MRPAGSWPGHRPILRIASLALALAVQIAVVAVVIHKVVRAPALEQDVQVVILPSPPAAPLPAPIPKAPDPAMPKLAVALPPPVIRTVEPQPPTPAPPSNAITPPAPPQPPKAPPPGVEDKFNAAVRAAVFAAHRIPDSARVMEIFGETQIAFTLTDGRVSDIRVISPSGHAILDDAALAAARNALYPPVPDELRGRVLRFEITLYRRHGGA